MSHFTVLVCIDGNGFDDLDEVGISDIVKDKLASFQENNMGDCPEKYMEFVNVEEEERESYETKPIEVIETPDGEYKLPFSEEFRRRKDGEKVGYEYIVPEGHEKIEVPRTEMFEDLEEYLEEYCGYNYDEEKEAYGYWCNPDAKWDWYVIGGRWNGMLLVEDDELGGEGDLGVFGRRQEEENPAPEGHKWVDYARVGDVKWSKMEKIREESREETWERAWEEHPVNMQFKFDEVVGVYAEENELSKEEIMEELKEEDELSDELKEFAEEHPDLEKVDKNESIRNFLMGVKPDDTKADFVKRSGFSTFAVLTKDGEWVERGSMGWFGVVTGENKDEVTWEKDFEEAFIESLDEGDIIVVVDCHI